MSSPSPLDRLRLHAVPVTIFSIVVVVTSIVPPLVLGAVSTRTYTITAAVLILAVGSVLPYSLLVAVGTLPLLYTGLASYAAPRPSADEAYSFSTMAAIRHVVAGVVYVLSAGVLGAIGFGAQMGAPTRLQGSRQEPIPPFLSSVECSLRSYSSPSSYGETTPTFACRTGELSSARRYSECC